MKWIKGLLLALMLLIGLPLLMVVFLTQSSSSTKTFEWDNGAVLRVEQLTYESPHRFGPPAFIGGLKQILPSLPVLPSIMHQTPSGSLLLWLTLKDTEQDSMLPLTNVVRVVARDKHGSRYISNHIETRDERHWRTQPSWGGTQTPPPTSKWFISLISLHEYPKGEDSFEVDLLDLNGNVIQTIEIKNPQVVQPSDWESAPLPVEYTHEDLIIRLNNFTNTWAISNIGREYGEIPQFRPDFEFLTKDKKNTPYWLFDSGLGEDTYGNSVTFSGYNAGNLSLHSSAWKISYNFYQQHDAPFPSDQVWELTLEVPEEGKSKTLELQKELIGIPVKLLNVTGPKTKAVYKDGKLESAELAQKTNGTSLSSSSTYVGGKFVDTMTYTSAHPYLGVYFPEDYHHYRIQMLAKDEKENYVPLASHSRTQHHYFISIREKQIASQLELKVIVQPVIQKSFFVRPGITPPVHQFKKADTIPERSSQAPPQTIDLTGYYTQKLDQHTHVMGRLGTSSYGTSFNYDGVEPGIHHINKQDWDLRGVVLMTGRSLNNFYLQYPEKIESIPIGSKASKIHFLHGCLWPGYPDEAIGTYIVHYANGTHQSIPLIYEKNIANVCNKPSQITVSNVEQATLVEIPKNHERNNSKTNLSYHFAWENPHPELIIDHIDVQSLRKDSAPILLGITLE